MAEFLNRIFNLVFGWLPHPVTIDPDEGGVLIRFGHYKRSLCEGWYWVWPPIESIRTINVEDQVIDLRCQSIGTKDHKPLAIGGAISYRIIRPEKALLKVQDHDRSLVNMALGVIGHHVNRSDLVNCMNSDDLANMVLESVRGVATERWGLKINSIWITDGPADCSIIRVIGNGEGMVMPIQEDYE